MERIIIDLKGVKSKEEILKRFQDIFEFNVEPINDSNSSQPNKGNWDVFIDLFYELDKFSEMYKRKMFNEKSINLTLKNVQDAINNCREEYEILISILNNFTDRQRCCGSNLDISFSFSIL